MGQAIVKTAPDRDLYLVWSSVVDAPIWVGNRAELLDHLWHEYRMEHPECMPKAGKAPEDRVRRADATGTSMSQPAGQYGWDDEALHVGEAAPRDGRWYQIRRDRLTAYAEALLADDEAAGWALMEPVDLDEPAGVEP